jgi:hypothetical protein
MYQESSTDESVDTPPKQSVAQSKGTSQWRSTPDTSPCAPCADADRSCFRHVKYDVEAARAKTGQGPAYSSCQSCRSQAKKCDPGQAPAPSIRSKRSTSSSKKRKLSRDAPPRKKMKQASDSDGEESRPLALQGLLSTDPGAPLHALIAELLSVRSEMKLIRDEFVALKRDV